MEMKLYPPDFEQVKKNIKAATHLDHALVVLINDEERQLAMVKEAANRLRVSLGKQGLKDVPVSELARSKSGIRVAALEKAGFTNLAQLAGRSLAALECIEGIGEVQAKAIQQTIHVFEQRMGDTTAIRLTLDGDNKDNDMLLLALYKYLESQPIRKDAAAICDRYHDTLSYAVSRIRIQNRIHWAFSTRETKESTIDGAETLAGIMQDSYPDRARNLLVQYDRIFSAQLPEAKADFERNNPRYYAMLEQLGHEKVSLESVYKDIPVSLAENIEAEELDPSLLNVTLRSYQAFGVRYILHQKQVLLGDEMGLGKTIMAIASMASIAAANPGAHFLVVCPASVLINWCREVERHSQLKAYLLHGESRRGQMEIWLENGGVAVTNYESTDEYLEELGEAKGELPALELLVVDEAHYIKNPEAKRTQYLYKIKEAAARTLLMTGTPLENRVDEMCSLIGAVRPDMVSEVQKYAFLNNTKEFKKILAPVYLRRVREDVLQELPELVDEPQWVSMTAEDREAYIPEIMGGNFMAMRRVAWLQDDLTHSSKASRLLELVDMAEDEGRKVIVFSYYRNTLDKVAAMLGKRCCAVINGSVSVKQRQEMIDAFAEAPAGSVLVSQVLAGGTGLNIQSASVVIFCEPQIKPSLETQAISRVYRMGQVRSVLVYHLLCDDTIDEDMIGLLSAKEEIFRDFAEESEAADAARTLSENEWVTDVVERQRGKYLPTIVSRE